jgi:DNA polymerase
MEEKLLAEDSPSLAYVPKGADQGELAAAAQRCQACHLYQHATGVVFGEGPTPAKMMFVGEQPDEREDRAGRPFVGPAGHLLFAALEEAEIPREQVYVTNAVKHFKWELRGNKRRLPVKPTSSEIHACRGWLEAEVQLVQPEVIVCLGTAAAQVFLGRSFRLTKSRGVRMDGRPWAARIVATYHPSALLRTHGDETEKARARLAFTLDLAEAASGVSFRATRPRHAHVGPHVAP